MSASSSERYPMGHMGFDEAMRRTREAVARQQSAVRAENSGFGAGSGMMAAATDLANDELDRLLRSMPREQLRAVIIRLAAEAR